MAGYRQLLDSAKRAAHCFEIQNRMANVFKADSQIYKGTNPVDALTCHAKNET
jgi:hypothetical protein